MDRFVPAPPAVALGALMVQREEGLHLAMLELSALEQSYRDVARVRHAADVVDMVIGLDAVRQRFLQLNTSATQEVLSFVKAGVLAVTAEENAEEDLAVALGVQYRVVIERAVAECPGFYEEAAKAVSSGEQSRVARQLATRLLIVDRSIACVPLFSGSSGDGAGALLVHDSGLLDSLIALFEQTWQSSAPMTFSAVGEPSDSGGESISERDSAILSLSMAGLTDAAVAGQLGLSLRSVQRRVRGLMDLASVDTRLQLGYQAGRRGWLPD